MTRACLLLLLLAACSKVSPPPPPADAAPRSDAAPAPLEGEDLARWYLDCVAREWPAACISPGVLAVNVGMDVPPVEGAVAYRANHVELKRMFPDLVYVPRLVLVNGRRLITVTASTGRRAQDGKLTSLDLADVLEVDGKNQLVRQRTYSDVNTLLWQIGSSRRAARAASAIVARPVVIAVEEARAEEAEHLELARLRIAAWNARDLAALEAGLAAKLLFHDLPAPRDFDRAAYLAAERSSWAARPGDTWTAESSLAAGAYVAVIGKLGRVSLLEILRFERGKISEAWRFYNSL